MTKVYAITAGRYIENVLAVAKTMEAAKAWAMDHMLTNSPFVWSEGSDPDSYNIEERDSPRKTYLEITWTRDTDEDPYYKDSYMVFIEPIDFIE